MRPARIYIETLQEIKSLGCLAGVTLNPGTPVSAIESVLHLADLVLVMSVNPGFSNQAFLPDAVGRVAKVRKMLDEMKVACLPCRWTAASTPRTSAVERCGRECVRLGQCHIQSSAGDRAGISALRAVITALSDRAADCKLTLRSSDRCSDYY